MFDLNRSELAAMADEYNFIRDTLEKVLRLIDILEFINTDPITKGKLALKGGTAINLTIFELPRLSVDIDLDLCGDLSRDEMLSQREEITDEIKKYMASQGYNLAPQSKERHSLDSFVFTYRNLGGMNDNIKIEINYSLRSHIFEPVTTAVLDNRFNTSATICCLEPIEIFAAKINALMSRAAVRDLYDTYNMVKQGLFSEEKILLRKCVILYTVISQRDFSEEYDLSSIDTITLKKVKSDLLPVIQKGEHVPLDEMKNTVKTFLSELLVLEDEETQFLALFKQKHFKPDLLFEDKDIIKRISGHPMIEWKLMR